MASSHSCSLTITLQGEIRLALLAVLMWVRRSSVERVMARTEVCMACEKLYDWNPIQSYDRPQTLWVSKFNFLTLNEDHGFFQKDQVAFLTPTIQCSHTWTVFKIWQKFLDDRFKFGAIEIPILNLRACLHSTDPSLESGRTHLTQVCGCGLVLRPTSNTTTVGI